MRFINSMLDVVGLAAFCVCAVTAKLAYCLVRLSMAGAVRSVLTISDWGLGTFARWSAPRLQLVTRGAKTWITISMGRFTAGVGIEKLQHGEWDITPDPGRPPSEKSK